MMNVQRLPTLTASWKPDGSGEVNFGWMDFGVEAPAAQHPPMAQTGIAQTKTRSSTGPGRPTAATVERRRSKIVSILSKAESPLRPTDISAQTGIDNRLMRGDLEALVKAGRLVHPEKGTYGVPNRDYSKAA